MSGKVSRRSFLAAGAGAVLAPLAYQQWVHRFSLPNSQTAGPNASLGHILRGDAELPKPSREEEIPVVIVGGGPSGLSAAWRLNKKNFRDFRLFELGDQVGGCSASGRNSTSAYPMGAHYVPLPAEDSHLMRELLTDLKVITGYNSTGHAIYDRNHVAHSPLDRILIDGHWYKGIVPKHGAQPGEIEQIRAFSAKMNELRAARGKDGRRLFSIPIEQSSRDEAGLRYDRISMKDFLLENGWDSPRLHWWVNYCCRDDFATSFEQASAWAGIHYHAARGGDADNVPSFAVLTWPQGNGWLVERLREISAEQIVTQALVSNIKPVDGGAEVDVYFPATKTVTRYHTEAVIYSGPRFTAARVLEPWRQAPPAHIQAFDYAPWVVANVTMDSLPNSPFDEQKLSWDNVNFESESMGYVVATHQEIGREQPGTVLTWYRPLTHKPGREARMEARERSQTEWTDLVVSDLEIMHPGIRKQIKNIEICVWGHGMVRPTVGFVWGEERQAALKPVGRVHFAHSDMSGVPIFEEANYRGATAADQVLSLVQNRSRG